LNIANNFCSISKKLIDSRTLIEASLVIRGNITIKVTAGENFILYQLNRPPAGLIFTQIRFAIYHYLGETMCMYSEQIYQLPVFKFSMQVHRKVVQKTLQTLCNFAYKHFKKNKKLFSY